MTISVVNLGTATKTGLATSFSFTIPVGGVPAGSLILAALTEENATAGVDSTISDSAGNSYSHLGFNLAGLAADGRATLFWCGNCLALVSGNTITITVSNVSNISALSICYATGIQAVANPQDSAVTASATGTTGTITVTSGTPTVAGELFIGALFDKGTSATGGNATFTQASGWVTPFTEIKSGSGASQSRVNGGNRVNAGTGTLTYNPTYSSTAQQWALSITAYKPAPSDFEQWNSFREDWDRSQEDLLDRMADEDWAIPYGPTDAPPATDNEQVVFTETHDDAREEYDDEYIARGDVDNPVPAIIAQVIVVTQKGDGAEDDYYFDPYGHIDIPSGVSDNEQIIYVADEQEALPEEDDALTQDRLSDLVFDTDHTTTILDDQEAPFEEDDALAQDRLIDPSTVVDVSEQITLVASFDEDPDQDDSEQWDARGTVDAAVVVDVSEQIVFVSAFDEDPDREDDASAQDRLSDLVFDTDHVRATLDDQEAPFEEDDSLAQDRLSDLVFDTDHIISIVDDQITDPDDDADYVDSFAQFVAIILGNNEQIIYVADEQAVDPDEDADYVDPFAQYITPIPGNNEQIIFIADTQDDDFVPDSEDDLWSAYGQTDLPPPPIPPAPPPRLAKLFMPGHEWQQWDRYWEPRRPMG